MIKRKLGWVIAAVLLTVGCTAGFRSARTGNAGVSFEHLYRTQSVAPSIATRINSQRIPMKASFGTSHARPRYNPYGSLQTSFIDGAVDAYNLGFETLKIWVGQEIRDPSFYFLTPAEIASYRDYSSALDIPAFQTVLSIPFKTVVLEADDELWSLGKGPLSQDAKDRVYRNTYNLAARLLKDFSGSSRTFIIQNHEGDWHIDPGPGLDAAHDPSAQSLQNFRDYWTLRQQAIEAARRAVRSDVQVYHLCEVVRVLPSLDRNAPSLTRDVLPQVGCDLVGYSAYESALQSNDRFEQALRYLRSQARVSPTFGTNQVTVSEIGLPERLPAYGDAAKQNLAALVKSLLDRGMPYVLFWNLYDNECTLPACSVDGGITSNVPESALMGFWVRRPDGQLGTVFSLLQSSPASPPAVASSPAGASQGAAPVQVVDPLRAALVRHLYTNLLGRSADETGLNFWASQGSSCRALMTAFVGSAEFKQRSAGLSNEAFLGAIYRGILAREPDPGGLSFWLGRLNSGIGTRDQVSSEFVASPETATVCRARWALD